MLKKVKLFIFIAFLAYISISFLACTFRCLENNRVLPLGVDFVRTYEGQEKVVFVLSDRDPLAPQEDTIEFFVKEQKLILIDRRDFDECQRYDEAYYVRMESKEGGYSFQNYLFATDSVSNQRQVGFSLMQNQKSKFVLQAADYPEDIIDSRVEFVLGNNIRASYRADSGIVTASSDQILLKRIK